jgi:hypothetical protein
MSAFRINFQRWRIVAELGLDAIACDYDCLMKGHGLAYCGRFELSKPAVVSVDSF